LALGLTLIGISAWRYRHGFQVLRRAFGVPEGEVAESERATQVDDLAPPAPLQLELSHELAPMQDALLARVAAVAQDMRDEFGVPVPAPVPRLVNGLGENGYRLSAFGARLASGQLRTDAAFRQAIAGGDATRQPGFFPVLAGEWVAPGTDGALEAAELLAAHARGALQRRLGGFIGIQETANLFARMQRDYPDLVKEMLHVVAPQRVADVLRRLAEEGVPIRNLRDVFEAITDVGGREKDVVLLTEYVRVALKREIAERHADA